MAAVVVVAVMPLGQWPFGSGPMAEISMAAIRDRSAVLADSELHYRDSELPMPLLAAMLKAAQADSGGVPARQLEAFLSGTAGGAGVLRVIFDPRVVLAMHDVPERPRLLVRFYDLADGHSARLRDRLGVRAGEGAYFMTLRP
jgi:hypothetical protein